MNKKRVTALAVSLSLVAVIGIGATLAYFTDQTDTQNVINMGHVDIDLVEHEITQDEDGNWDGKGLRPEQVQGYGLGVMNARAAYFAKKNEKLSSFLTEGRSFGPHGTGLFIANSIENYNEEISQELPHKTVTANLVMREIGFKPYVAPALSSGALSILLTLRGEWHCGSVFLDGIFMGCKNRYTPAGVETELLPHIPDPLFAHIQEAADHLKTIL